MYRLGFTSVTFRHLAAEEVAKIANKAGIKYIEWGGDTHLPIGEGEKIAAIDEKYSLTPISYGSYYRLGACDYEQWRNILDTAEIIGAPRVRIWQGNKASSQVSAEEYKHMVEETRTLADMAAEKGIVVAFEYHNNTNNDNGVSGKEFLAAVGRENVTTYWQPQSCGEDMSNIVALKGSISAVHVFEWNKHGKRYALKKGEKNWSEFLSLLKSEPNDIDYILEFVKHDSPKRFMKDVEFFKSMLEDCYNG